MQTKCTTHVWQRCELQKKIVLSDTTLITNNIDVDNLIGDICQKDINYWVTNLYMPFQR